MENRMPIIISLAVGLVAVLLTNLYVNQIRQAAQPETSLVMVAASDLAPGAILEAKDVTQAERYTRALPKFHISWGERNLYLGQELRFSVSAGDYILVPYFSVETGQAQRLSGKVDLKLSQRAMTIPVSSETSLEGSIRAGDRIDLLLTYTATLALPPDKGGASAGRAATQVVTVPLLDNAYVLATGKYNPNEPDIRYKSITLLLGADEAKLLIWALKLGELSVLLRNPKDLQPTDRAYLAGNTSSLQALGRFELRVEDVLSKQSATGKP